MKDSPMLKTLGKKLKETSEKTPGRPAVETAYISNSKITVSIDDNIHHRLRVTAAKTRRPVWEIICQALDDHLPKEV